MINHQLAQLPPFNLLSESQRDCIMKHSSLVYLSEQQSLSISSDDKAYLLVMFKGKAQWQDDQQNKDLLEENSIAGSHILLHGGQGELIALEEVLVYQIQQSCFLQLCDEHREFLAYWNADIRSKRDALHQQAQTGNLANFMMLTLNDVQQLPYLILEDHNDLRQASQHLREHRSTAALVNLADGKQGIFTTTDLLNAFTDYPADNYPSLSQLAKSDIICLEADEHLFKALLLMTEHHLSHIVITKQQQPIGFLHQKTLLGALASQSFIVAQQIEQAVAVDDLLNVPQQLETMVEILHDKGVKARYIADMVSSLNRALLRKVALLTQPAVLHDLDYTFVVLGSEGRQEQILRTDQDNALFWQGEADEQAIRQWAEAIYQALHNMGFPDCSGNIMVTNPLWCQPLAKMQQQIKRWAAQSSNEANIYLSILLDADTISGSKALTHQLLQQVRQQINHNRSFLGHFAKSTLEFETPLGFFSQLKTEAGHYLDVKKGGLFAIVHGVRVLACESHITDKSTLDRLQSLGKTRLLSAEFADEVSEAFDFLQQLKLQQQLVNLAQGKAIDNRIHIKKLSALQLDLLKDCLKVINRFKELVSHHYKLNQLM